MKVNSKKALSPVGIAIAIICLLGVVMILTAPMLADKYAVDNEGVPVQASVSVYDLQEKIDALSARLETMEEKSRRMEETLRAGSSSRESYSCSMEGVVDADGNLVSLTAENSANPETRYVMVCSKR